jgi:hypothetical protein
VDEKLKNLAEKIRQIANIPEEETFGSVMAILMIISITLTLIRVMQECNKTKLSTTSSKEDKVSLYGTELRHYSIGKGWFTKMRIKKIIRQKMSKEQYNMYGASLLNALLSTGETLTDEEVSTLVENANV